MPKLLTAHQVNECNRAITIEADDPDPNCGNASCVYDVTWRELDESGMHVELVFQRGPIKEVGTNGLTHEVLLAILVDRIEGFETGPFACDENQQVLGLLKEAQAVLLKRTRERLERGVEGTHTV